MAYKFVLVDGTYVVAGSWAGGALVGGTYAVAPELNCGGGWGAGTPT